MHIRPPAVQDVDDGSGSEKAQFRLRIKSLNPKSGEGWINPNPFCRSWLRGGLNAGRLSQCPALLSQ